MNKSRKNPFIVVWNILSVPMSVLGLLGLSDSLLSFHEDLQNIITSYKAVIHPVFELVFCWTWFDVPTLVYDYLFVGILFSSSSFKAVQPSIDKSNFVKSIFFHVKDFVLLVMLWPLFALSSFYNISRTDSERVVKGLDGSKHSIKVLYLGRDTDVLTFYYMGSVFLIFIVILIVNYTFLKQ